MSVAADLIRLGLVVTPAEIGKAPGRKGDTAGSIVGLTIEQLANRQARNLPDRYSVVIGSTGTGPRSGIVDVETDIDKATGEMVGEASLASAGIVLPDGPYMLTPSGSKHRLLRVPEAPEGQEIRLQVVGLLGEGSKVDVPWQFLAVDEGLRTWHDMHLPIPDAPPELVATLLREKKVRADVAPGEWDGDGFGTAAAVSLIERKCEELRLAPDGTWNNTLNAVTFLAGQLVAGGTLDAEHARDSVFGALDDPDDYRALSTFESAWNAGLANPRVLDEDLPLTVTLLDEDTPEIPPFPVDALPPALRDLVIEGSRSICCPPDYIGAAGLAILGAAIGGKVQIHIGGGWYEKPMLWVAIVGDPGARKSPALKPLLAPVFAEQETLIAAARVRREQESKDAKDDGRPPKRVVTQRVVIDDTTVEALHQRLEDNPRGVLMHSDELVGWAKGMGAYKGGLGRDRQHWLSIWSSQSFTIDRKGDDGIPIFVKNPFVAVVGGIQPGVVSDIGAGRDDGLMDRLLLAQGSAVPIRLSRDNIADPTLEEYEALWHRLREDGATRRNVSLDEIAGADAHPFRTVEMSPEAWDVYQEWHDRIAEDMGRGPASLRGIWAKMPGQCARIALVLAMCAERRGSIDPETVSRAIRITEYFMGQARQLLASSGSDTAYEKEHSDRMDRLEEWLKQNPEATMRQVLRSGPGRWSRKKESLEPVLRDLIAAGRVAQPVAQSG